MPFKIEVLKYVDEVNDEVKEIGAANTIINTSGILRAYNTDIYAANKAIKMGMGIFAGNELYIIGNGGYSKAVQYSAKNLNISFNIVTRENWNELENIKGAIIYNCTPVENLHKKLDAANFFVDCITTTEWGKRLSLWQASKQFEMYTGIEYKF